MIKHYINKKLSHQQQPNFPVSVTFMTVHSAVRQRTGATAGTHLTLLQPRRWRHGASGSVQGSPYPIAAFLFPLVWS